jgi:hypothetical protein
MVIPVSTNPLVVHSKSVPPAVSRTMFQNRASPLSGKSAGNDLFSVVCSPWSATSTGAKRERAPGRFVSSPGL